MNNISTLTEAYMRSEKLLDERIKQLLEKSRSNALDNDRLRLLRTERYALRKIITHLKNYYYKGSDPSIKGKQKVFTEMEAVYYR